MSEKVEQYRLRDEARAEFVRDAGVSHYPAPILMTVRDAFNAGWAARKKIVDYSFKKAGLDKRA